MTRLSVKVYVTAMVGAAVWALAATEWSSVWALPRGAQAGLVMLILMSLFF